jgi:hypothetical protein
MRFFLQFLFLQVALGTAINIHIDIEEGGVGMLESSSILSNDFEDYAEPPIDMERLTEISGDWGQQPISINRDYDYGTPRGGVVCSGWYQFSKITQMENNVDSVQVRSTSKRSSTKEFSKALSFCNQGIQLVSNS